MPLIQGGRKPIGSRIHAERLGVSDASQISEPHADAAADNRITNKANKDEEGDIERRSKASTSAKDDIDILDALQDLDKNTLIELLSQACQEYPSFVSRVLQTGNQTS